VTLELAVGETSEDSTALLIDQWVVMQRVPHFNDVMISGDAALTTAAWEDGGTGVLAFRALDTVWVESGSSVSVWAGGYTGGATGTSNNCDAYQGESYAGLGNGDGDGACSDYNEVYGHWAPNEGGGGAHITGAGGSYGASGEDGDSWDGGTATAPMAGDTYGLSSLSLLFHGSGGGGVWNGATATIIPGPGGNGGGILIVGASSIEADDVSAFVADGGDTESAAAGTYTYGAGGGAGGSLWLLGDSVDLAASSVTALGGFGQKDYIRDGGDGGDGRIRIDCDTCNGYSHASLAGETAMRDASEPDLGSSNTLH